MPKKKTPQPDTAEEPDGQELLPMTHEEVVQYIVDSFPMESPTGIAKTLNEDGARDANGRKWNKVRVEEVAEANSHRTPTWAASKPGKNVLEGMAFDEPYDDVCKAPLTAVERRRVWKWNFH